MTILPSWADVYVEEYRHADIHRDLARRRIAEEAKKSNGQSEPRKPFSFAVMAIVVALVAHVFPHIGRS